METDIEILNRLDNLRLEFTKTRNILKNNQNWLYEQSWNTFISGMSMLPSQIYGPGIQKRFINDNGYCRNMDKDDNGDYTIHDGSSFELKTSLITSSNQKLNMVQIRLWQKVNYNFLVFILLEQAIYVLQFELTHSEMENEISLMNSSSAHGTQKTNLNNKHIEKRLSLNIDIKNKHFKRWYNKYRTKFLANDQTIKDLYDIELFDSPLFYGV